MPKQSPDGKLMSISAYARHRKVSLAAIQDALKRGRIRFADSKGKWIDPKEADREWSRNTDFSKVRGNEIESKGYSTARTAREHYMARLAKLEYEIKSGQLVSVENVKKDAFETGRIVRDAILTIPDRISAELVGITDQATMHGVLTKELQNALLELTRGPKLQ